MPEPITFDVESYFNEFADASAMAEAARFRTIPTGSYTLQVTKREGCFYEEQAGGWWKRVFGETGDEVKPTWRKGVRLSAQVFSEEGKKIGMVNIEASWEAKRDGKTGEYDRLFKRWEQLTRALYPNLSTEERSKKGVGDILGAVMQYPIKSYLTESFHVPAIDGSNKWTTAKSDEEAKQFRTAGYKVANFVVSVSKV